MTGELYLYGIAGPGVPPVSQVYGLAGRVSLLEQGGLGAIVGAPPEDGFQELSRERALRLLLGHQEVLEAAMVKAAVLPVKFGTIAPHKTAVQSLLRQKKDMLAELLAEFGGRRQIEILVSWQPEAVFAGIAGEPEIIEARNSAQASQDKTAAVRLGHTVKAAFERHRERLKTRIEEALKPLTIDLVFNTPMDDRMAVNLAVLISEADSERLQAAVEELDAEFGGRLTFRCVGPLPPASFATLQVSFPSVQAISRARQVLGLTGPSSQEDITSAFRRLALEHHPDLAEAGEESAKQMAELTAAYRLLVSCIKSQGPEAPEGDRNVGIPVLVEIARHNSGGLSKR
jgi:hypothetical protein